MLEFIPDYENVPLWIKDAYTIVYLIASFLYLKRISQFSQYGISQKQGWYFVAFFVIFAIFYCVNSDYFNYRFWALNYVYFAETFAKEMVYMLIARIANGNYEIFRFIVWGGAIILTSIAMKLMKVNLYIGVAFWFVCYYDKICYARASLGMAVFVLGLALLCSYGYMSHQKKIGLVIASLAVLFHRSLIVVIALIPILLFKLSRDKLFVYLALIVVFVRVILGSIINIEDFMSDDYAATIAGYTNEIESEEYATSFSNYIKLFWRYSLFYVPFVIATNTVFQNRYVNLIPVQIMYMYKASAGIMLVATSFCIVYGLGNPFFYRILYVSAAPLSIVFIGLYQNGYISSKVLRLVVYNSILSHIVYTIVARLTH